MVLGISIAAIAATSLCAVVAGCQSSGESSDQAATAKAHGKQIFMTICATCHGPDGTGVKGLGKSFVTSEYVRDSSDDQLVDLLMKGRDPTHPLNTTGVLMPPKGGNPALTEKDLRDVVAYVRTLNHPG